MLGRQMGKAIGELGPGAEAFVIAGLCLPLLMAAIWNGYPLIFYDTGGYLAQGLRGEFYVERAPVYSLFLRLSGGSISLWFSIILQALMTSYVLVQTARLTRPGLPLWALLLIGIVLCVVTGLPWYVGQIVPDSMAAVVICTAYLLGFHQARLGVWRFGLLIAMGAVAAACHSSHLGLMAGFALVLMVLRLLMRRQEGAPNRVQPWGVILCFGLALSTLLATNYVLTRDVFVSRAGANFVFGRLLQDGIVSRLLEETCPASGYDLCAYQGRLPKTADLWLWGGGSPFLELGRFEGTRAESARMIADSLRLYPVMHVTTALRSSLVQIGMFRTGDQIEPQQWLLYNDFKRLIPAQLPAYLEARQQTREFDFTSINQIHLSFGWMGLLGLAAVLMISAMRRQRDLFWLALIFSLGIGGNALICGALSNPHDRYQSRIMWLPPFAVMLGLSALRRRES